LRITVAVGTKVDDIADFFCRTLDDLAVRAGFLGLRWREFFN
jgi:hypothetical protein